MISNVNVITGRQPAVAMPASLRAPIFTGAVAFPATTCVQAADVQGTGVSAYTHKVRFTALTDANVPGASAWSPPS